MRQAKSAGTRCLFSLNPAIIFRAISFRIRLRVVRRLLVEKDEYQRVAGFGHHVAALARYLSGHAACVFRNHFAEAVALDGHLLSGLDLFVEPSVARIGNALLPTKTVTSLPVRPIGPATIP